MGINPRDLSPRAKAAIAKGLTLQRQAKAPFAGSVRIWIDGEPPTATHQAKDISWYTDTQGRQRRTLVDRPQLRAAIQTYLSRIPENQGGPLAGPTVLSLEFRWSAKDADAPPAVPHVDKPDWDNAGKTLCDVLVERGWIAADEQVCVGRVEKVRVNPRSFKPGALVLITTTTESSVTSDAWLPKPGVAEIEKYGEAIREQPKVAPDQEGGLPREG